MDILFISKYFVVIASMIMMLAALRASAYKSTTMGLLSSSVVVVAFALSLLVVGDMYGISFFKDSAFWIYRDCCFCCYTRGR